MRPHPLPSLEHLKECFELSDESPSGLVWKRRPREHFKSQVGWSVANSQCAGRAVTCKTAVYSTGRQYYRVRLDDRLYQVHRIVYSLRANEVVSPDFEIDHRNCNGLDNSEGNLRQAEHRQNAYNTSSVSRNTSGSKGVYLDRRNNLWYGQVVAKGKTYSTGYSPSKMIIAEMVQELRNKLHKEFAHHNGEVLV